MTIVDMVAGIIRGMAGNKRFTLSEISAQVGLTNDQVRKALPKNVKRVERGLYISKGRRVPQ